MTARSCAAARAIRLQRVDRKTTASASPESDWTLTSRATPTTAERTSAVDAGGSGPPHHHSATGRRAIVALTIAIGARDLASASVNAVPRTSGT